MGPILITRADLAKATVVKYRQDLTQVSALRRRTDERG